MKTRITSLEFFVKDRIKYVFTLIELLIVIAVIAILASMLLPALNKARATARSTQCLSNIRQIGMGIFFYTNDWRGYLPENRSINHYWKQIGIYFNETFSHNVAKNNIWWCPEYMAGMNHAKQAGYPYIYNTGYGMGPAFSYPWGWQGHRKKSQLKVPSGLIMLTETTNRNHPEDISTGEVYSSRIWIAGRHHNKNASRTAGYSSITWADGHVTSVYVPPLAAKPHLSMPWNIYLDNWK